MSHGQWYSTRSWRVNDLALRHLGLGVVILHGRIRQLREVTAVFVRPYAGIPFDAPDAEPVRLILALLVPEHANEQHPEFSRRVGPDVW